MRRFFAQNIFFLILLNLIVKPIWVFAIERNVQITVGHAVFGQYQALLNLSILLQILLDFGLQNYSQRTVSRSPQIVNSLFPNILMAKIIMSFLYLCITMILGYILGYRGVLLMLLFMVSWVTILQWMVQYLRSNVSALQRFKSDSLLSVADKLLVTIICSVLLFSTPFKNDFKIEWFIYAQIAALAITAILAFIVCKKLIHIKWNCINFKKIYIICKQSLPFAFLFFLMAIYLRADTLIIERWIPNGAEQSGIYASAYRLLEIANNTTGMLFGAMLLPLLGNMLSKKISVTPVLALSFDLLFPIAIISSVAALFWSESIMFFLYGNHTVQNSGEILLILLMAFPFINIVHIFTPLLAANGNIRLLIKISLLAAIINITSNLILTNYWGAQGAAMACLITNIFLAITCFSSSFKIFRFKITLKDTLKCFGFIMYILSIGYCLNLIINDLTYNLLILFMAGGVGMIFFGFINANRIKEIIKIKS